MLVDPLEEPNIEAMIAKHEDRLSKGFKIGAPEAKALPASVKL
jgi:hypothetical protein